MLSKKSIQGTDETLRCAKYSQHDCFGDWKPESQVLSLLHSSGSMEMDGGTGGWEVSRSNAQEDPNPASKGFPELRVGGISRGSV